MRHPEVEEQNKADDIRVHYGDGEIVVDGTEATFPEAERAEFRFPQKLELHPFPTAYDVPTERIGDKQFIRALTVKEQSQVMETKPVLELGGRSWNALQLRAMVKEVRLADTFDRLGELAGDAEAVKLSLIHI